MKKENVRATVNEEVAKFGKSLISLTVGEVHTLYAAQAARYGAGRDAYQALRTEISAALQLKNPPPHTHDLEDAEGNLTDEEHEALHAESRLGVSDEHRLLADHARSLDPNHDDAHHFVQKLHGVALWREVDRIIAEAGILPVGVKS